MSRMVEVEIEIIGPMPAYYKIADDIWGEDADIDSDGNSETAESTDWSELTIILRSDQDQRIDIDTIPGKEHFLLLCASSKELSESVMQFLRDQGSIK
ncbi:hypothetical protein CWC22_011065 [Pseudoalteromonas rubra]|uniref:Uncharacterized protein n=1 Tax=Pseudoalteromonas rubra TaxID=43658 RepID=A0A7S7YWU8_9GAMM|nr:hypothetical protein [Pseudoalteromonas rubra]QPB83498.1 hypothetical protein CWC22_011065 [Pseudoalteromonas rubra]